MGWDAGPGSGDNALHADLTARWTAALGEGARDHVVPMSADEARLLLTELARELEVAAHTKEPTNQIVELGAELAQAHFVGDEVLGRSIAVLCAHLGDTGIPVDRLAELLGAFTNGYIRAFRTWLLAEQESVRAADIVARHTAERQLRESEARLRAVFTQAGIGTGLLDMTGRIVEVNTAFATMLGYEPAQMYELALTDLVHPDDEAGMWDLYTALLRGEHDSIQVEKAYPHRAGHTVWTNLNFSLIRDEHDRPQYTLVLVEDISEQRALRERLQFRAHHDQLTGLPNRSRFIDALTDAFADAGSTFGLCYVDLDNFKMVNDTFGHAVGDELLIQVARRLRDCAGRPDQLVARMGGDEYVVLVPQFDGSDTAAELAQTMLDTVATPFDIDGHNLTVTASIGVLQGRCEHATADELLQAADTTMYWAKAAGRGRYAVFDADRGRQAHARSELSAAMPTALGRGELFLDYQPIVGLADERTMAVEALVRWRHPDLGVLPPSQFVELAEDNGHIGALGALVLERACADGRDWYDRFREDAPIVSVNVAATEVADPTWLDRVQEVLTETGLPPDRLQLELTERAFMHTTGRPLQALRTLAESGVNIAIDDFGTGYSNLAYLGQLPLDVVKLAGPFIRCLRTPQSPSTADLLILETIIELTHALGCVITAECVETQHQANRLRDLGCDTAQGWLFHRPMPVHQVTELLVDRSATSVGGPAL
ncbi:putative bifunctional diguanylate cyclase/phosphodiesterase [Nocardia australiensis]|uniref:putative bifunctional diguanylate cyclase/phosphodiesterase n=1 Tax=Nocardia australiensis TaxID=2887191 RepID=UPI001D156649|nr:EAL domain-containing protein [Nocardia australiensis]